MTDTCDRQKIGLEVGMSITIDMECYLLAKAYSSISVATDKNLTKKEYRQILASWYNRDLKNKIETPDQFNRNYRSYFKGLRKCHSQRRSKNTTSVRRRKPDDIAPSLYIAEKAAARQKRKPAKSRPAQ